MGVEIYDRSDYYPFGQRWTYSGIGGAATQNRWLYNGKEHQSVAEFNFLDYGARQYDPILGRWHSPDRLLEKYYRWSPYTYTLNNPINAIDPDGKLVIFINGMHGRSGGKTDYWNGFDNAVMEHLNDYNSRYYDRSVGGMIGLYGKSARTGLTYSNLNFNLTACESQANDSKTFRVTD